MSNNLKYKKRVWHKFIGKVFFINLLSNNVVELVFYKGKNYIRMICLDKELSSKLLLIKPKTKLVAWFSIISKRTKGYWSTYLYLMHYENPMEEKIKAEQEQKDNNNYLQSNFNQNLNKWEENQNTPKTQS